jgi:hypothetical protein
MRSFGRTDLRTLLRVSDGYLTRMIADGRFVSADFYIGRSPRWLESTVMRWLDSQKQQASKK